jgi:hypothetical protein
MAITFEHVFGGALWLLPGGLSGVFTMLILRRLTLRVAPTTSDEPSVPTRVWVHYVLRLGIVAVFLILAARGGIGPLLWAFTGLMVSRWAVVVWWSGGLGT